MPNHSKKLLKRLQGQIKARMERALNVDPNSKKTVYSFGKSVVSIGFLLSAYEHGLILEAGASLLGTLRALHQMERYAVKREDVDIERRKPLPTRAVQSALNTANLSMGVLFFGWVASLCINIYMDAAIERPNQPKAVLKIPAVPEPRAAQNNVPYRIDTIFDPK